MAIPPLPISAFTYELPDEKIARYPLKNRDQSRLLVSKNGTIRHRYFSDLGSELPSDASLVLNNTQVVPARLPFVRSTGAAIEILCLEPSLQSVEEAMQATSHIQWNCIVGNLKKFKPDETLELSLGEVTLSARLVNRLSEGACVDFRWESGHSFSEILDKVGQLPLPPYLNRKAEEGDKDWYQTVYAQRAGAVAAPTAGLHFTDQILEALNQKGIESKSLTLHVGAGTFKPVKAERLDQHDMHEEQISVSLSFLKWLRKQSKIIAVGTTSMRSLESIYWLAVLSDETTLATFLKPEIPYSEMPNLSRKEALDRLIHFMERRGLDSFHAKTALFVMPGYSIKMCDGLITNFHQPKSTLLALVATLVGEDWKKIYQDALENDYRFLSYGDSSLLLP